MAVNIKEYVRECIGVYLPYIKARFSGDNSVKFKVADGTQSYHAVSKGQFDTAINTKVSKVEGKELSSNDFNDALKTKLEALPENDLGVCASICYTGVNQGDLSWDNEETAIKLESKTDSSVGVSFQAFAVNELETYDLSIFIKGVADRDHGLYIRVYEHNGDTLPDGTSYISGSSSTMPEVTEHTSLRYNWIEDGAITEDWKHHTHKYTPNSGVKWASIVVLNWAANGVDPLWIKEPTKVVGDTWENIYLHNFQNALTGGGVIYYNGSGRLKWHKRFIGIAVGGGGVGTIATSAYYNIDMPTVGTTIHGAGSTPDHAVTVNGIILDSWETLWYELPLYTTPSTRYNNFHKIRYNQSSGFKVPKNWILIAVGNGDVDSGRVIKVCNGVTIPIGSVHYPDSRPSVPTLGNGWLNYSSGYGSATYRRKGGYVYLNGLIKNGTISEDEDGTVFTLPANFRPKSRMIFNTICWEDNKPARIDVLPNGDVRIITGHNVWVSLNISFPIKGI